MTKEETYEILRVRIVTNAVPPGEILNEKDFRLSNICLCVVESIVGTRVPAEPRDSAS